MPPSLIALFSIASLVSAQIPHAFFQTAVPPPPAMQTTAPASARTLTLPAGTAIPLTLINPIKKKSTKPGDAVRATVAFPIMAGMQVAIPAGSYVEGVVKTVTARASDTQQPEVGIHFTRLVFANGYSVSLDANSTQAEDFAPRIGAPGAAEGWTANGRGYRCGVWRRSGTDDHDARPGAPFAEQDRLCAFRRRMAVSDGAPESARGGRQSGCRVGGHARRKLIRTP